MSTPARIHPDEPGAVALLDQAITALSTALDEMPISEVINIKAKIATIETATKQLGMSKEAQEYATEAVRRSEWALGRAVRRGQDEGLVAKATDTLRQSRSDQMDERSTVSPDEFTQAGRERNDVYAVSKLDTVALDEVLDEAKAEGNLSRANVARKAREKAGHTPEPAAAGSAERAHQEAELVNAFGAIVRRSLTPKNVATLTPKARARLISILNDALNTLQETSS